MFDLLAPSKRNGPIRYQRYACVIGRLTLNLADGVSELAKPLKTISTEYRVAWPFLKEDSVCVSARDPYAI